MRFKQIDDDSSKFFPQRKERDLSRGEKVTWELRKKKKKSIKLGKLLGGSFNFSYLHEFLVYLSRSELKKKKVDTGE